MERGTVSGGRVLSKRGMNGGRMFLEGGVNGGEG